jgi:hypothetical protein
LLGTPSLQSVHDYYPFAKENEGWLAPIAAELIDRMAILVAVRRFPCMCAADSRSLRYDSHARVELLTFLFDVFWGMCDKNSCNVFLLLLKVLWLPISATLCMRAFMMFWHAFMFLWLRFFPHFFVLLGGFHCFSL